MKFHFRFWTVILNIAFFTGLSRCTIYAQDTAGPKNVILFIGDGMGLSHVYAAYTRNHGHLNMMQFPVTGFCMTHPDSGYITDSGASATAISCGKKTYNGAVGVDADGIPCKTILEYAEENGLSTGLISTSAITHATPAAFIAHQKNRAQYEAIAADFLKTDIDVIIGGGGDHFSKRSDSVNLISRMKTMGYEVAMYPSALDTFLSDKVAVFTAPMHNPSISDGRGSMLPDATEMAISILGRNDKGFFLMVEGSQIDWGAHNNDIDYVIDEVIDMDIAVGKAIAFAKQQGNTLVIVTADHETGGLSIIDGDMATGTVNVDFSTSGHTGLMVPVFACGPGAENFSGSYQNTDIFKKITNLLKLTNPCISHTPSK